MRSWTYRSGLAWWACWGLAACGPKASPEAERLIVREPTYSVELSFDEHARCTPAVEVSAPACAPLRGELIRLQHDLEQRRPAARSLRLAGVLAANGMWTARQPERARRALTIACQRREDRLACVYLAALDVSTRRGAAREVSLQELATSCAQDAADACEVLVFALDLEAAERARVIEWIDAYEGAPPRARLAAAELVGANGERKLYAQRRAAITKAIGESPAGDAMALFYGQRASLTEIEAIELTGSMQDQQRELMRVLALVRELTSNFNRIEELDPTGWGVYARVGRAWVFYTLADALRQASQPVGLSPSQATTYARKLEELTPPLVERAERDARAALEQLVVSERGHWLMAWLYARWR